MKTLKQTARLFRIILFAFMLSVCIVMGIAPIVPKRKQEVEIEVIVEEEEEEHTNRSTNISQRLIP